MIQNLFNNINNIQETATTIASNFSSNDTKTDFQKLFEKQDNYNTDVNNTKTLADSIDLKNDKKITKNTNSTDNDTVIQPKDTFAGSVLYNIRELIAFLNSAAEKDDNSTDTQDTDNAVNNAVLTENNDAAETSNELLDAEEITKNILHIEDEKDDEKEEKTADNKKVTEEVEEISSDTESLQKILNYENIDNLLKTADVTTEEVETTIELQANSEVQAKPKETVNDSEDILNEIIDEEQLKELNIESVEAETSGDTESDLMKHESVEEHGIKAMFQTDGDYADIQTNTKPVSNTQTVKPNNILTEANPNKILEQITKQMESLNSGSRVNIVLNPESLGKVSIQLINTPEGLSAQFTVTTQDAKNLLMKGLDGLKESLLSHGVSVDNVTVKMNETQESEYNADWTEQEGSGGGNQQGQARQEEQDKERFEQMMFNIENKENGKV